MLYFERGAQPHQKLCNIFYQALEPSLGWLFFLKWPLRIVRLCHEKLQANGDHFPKGSAGLKRINAGLEHNGRLNISNCVSVSAHFLSPAAFTYLVNLAHMHDRFTTAVCGDFSPIGK
tara:strand:+ start:927 stop:1280 length:354 start_codon:yes stop_codon:yes gene_type:complete